MVRKKIKHKGMPRRGGMLLSRQQLPRVHMDSGDFITKLHHHKEEFLNARALGRKTVSPSNLAPVHCRQNAMSCQKGK